jgi:hypothetical protein
MDENVDEINNRKENIISLILKKYNKTFDENKVNENVVEEEENIVTEEDINKTKAEFKKLLLEVADVEKETKCIIETKDLFENNISLNSTKIHQMNFIQDIDLVAKVVKYRKLEIKKQIRIINLSIEVYKHVIVKLNCYNYFLSNPNLQLNTQNLEQRKLLDDKQKCINIFNAMVFNDNAYFLNDTLCRYVNLEKKLSSFSKTKTAK